MKFALIITAILIQLSTWAQPGEEFYREAEALSFQDSELFYQVVRTDSIYRPQLSEDEAIYTFNFDGLHQSDTNAFVQYSIDSVNYDGQLNSGQISILTTPGIHYFQFYLNENYLEVFSGSLNIAPQHEYKFSTYLFQRAPSEPVMTFKPVIYLYPGEKTSIDVQLEIHDGKHPFYYPSFNESWTCVASPDGNLEMNGINYRYLFWEAQQADHLNQIDVNEGFVVNGNEGISFLEDKLREVGFTSEEQADFITFWGPKLAANEKNLVRFEWNETCDKFADLNISPQPDHTYRFYIFTSAIDSDIEIQPQALPTFDREGFVALEWGGQISNYQPDTSL
jgi:hypothetical protein